MKRIRHLQTWTGLAGITALIVLMLWNHNLWARAALVLFVGLSIYVWLMLERKRQQEQSEALLIRTVNHYRHDWMNDFQVMLGYVRLKKYDRLAPNMEIVKMRLHQESCLSKLGSPSLIAYLISYRTTRPEVELEIAIEQEIQLDQLPVPLKQVTKRFRKVIEAFNTCAIPTDGEPNRLSVELDIEDQALLLDFVYEGQYEADSLKEAVAKIAKHSEREMFMEQQWNDDKIILMLRFPFQR